MENFIPLQPVYIRLADGIMGSIHPKSETNLWNPLFWNNIFLRCYVKFEFFWLLFFW